MPCQQNIATGVNFAVFAPRATQVDLCLFSTSGHEAQLPMYPSSEGIWHLFVEDITAGQQYGFRADGHWSSNATPRFNRNKLLLDPFSREIKGEVTWTQELFDYSTTHGEWTFNTKDSAPFMPRSVVREAEFDWQGVEKPNTPDQSSVIYETHVKGFTHNHPGITENLRGTYLGMCHPVTIEFLKGLGVTAVELLPVTSKVSEERLTDLGLANYWGYNPICMMAPEPAFAIDDPVTEMKTMVRELHRAGIEVIMDVVYNHTCESGHGGPFMSFRGLAENEYYHMDSHNGKLSSVNYSGCGNTMNFDSPQTLKLTMDALRCWADEYQIDGFRFDLAPTMARQHRHFNKQSPFFYAISQDPLLSSLKMIAEPWDIGPDGYHVSDFPADWQSWNDRYRDACRKFWKGEANIHAEMAQRFAGSDDLFVEQSYLATVNYICSHDGFNMMDLVSYENRLNHANGEDNRDGDEHNYSWNNGVEGETDNQTVQRARLQARKNLIAMLMLAKGTPMLLAGDDFSNSQQGNNNAYCQDSPISWLDWNWLEKPEDSEKLSDGKLLHRFTSQMIQYRKEHALLTNDLNNTAYEFFSTEGNEIPAHQLNDIANPLLSVKIRSKDNSTTGALIVLMNPSSETIKVTLPTVSNIPRRWFVVMDTKVDIELRKTPLLHDGWYEVSPNSLVIIEDIQ